MCIGCVSFWLDQVDLLYTSCGVTEMSGTAHAPAKAGAVNETDGDFRARVQYRGEDGRMAHLCYKGLRVGSEEKSRAVCLKPARSLPGASGNQSHCTVQRPHF